MEKFCPHCSKPNSFEAHFCRHCASPLPTGQQGARPYAEPQQRQHANQQWNQGGQGGGNYMQPQAGASGRAVASLILTACGLVLCCGPLTGIPGAVLGWMEVSAIRAGRAPQKGLMMAQIALWGGIAVSVVIGLLNLVMIIPMLLGGAY